MKKTASAFAAGMARGAEIAQNSDESQDEQPSRPVGNWSRMSVMEMEKLLHEKEANHDVIDRAIMDGILAGHIPMNIPADQIIDEVGTDRILETADDESDAYSFGSLIDNIRARGLKVPLRVRPSDPDWRPSKENPRDVGEATFILQSGRRRLEACKKIGITPHAFISLAEGDYRLDDLQERFFENASRKNLTLIEKLYSIGLLAEEFEGKSQDDIASYLGVGQAYVSRGLAVVEYFDRLKIDLDLSEATNRDIENQVKIYRSEKQSEETTGEGRGRSKKTEKFMRELPFRQKLIGRTDLSLKANARGERIMALRSSALDDEAIERIVEVIQEAESRAGGS